VSGKESSFSDTVTAQSTTDQDAVNLSKNGNEASGFLLFFFLFLFVLKHNINVLSSEHTRLPTLKTRKSGGFEKTDTRHMF